MSRAAATLGVLASVLLLAACGGDSPEDADRDAIAAVLNELFQAQEAGDAQTACRDVYVIQEPPPPGGGEVGGEAEEAHAEAEGSEQGAAACEAAFEQADAQRRREIRDLSTEIGAIELAGDRATAIVATELRRRDGSLLSQDASYDLVRTPEGWRIRISEEG